MRLIALLTIAVLAATPAVARDPAVHDGRYTICAFQDFEKCERLTTRALRRYDLSADEKLVLRKLRRHTATGHATLATLEGSFGKSSKIFPHRRPSDRTVAWYQNSVGMNDLNAKCPECGLYISSLRNSLTSINYIVDQKFTIVWNRASPRKSRR